MSVSQGTGLSKLEVPRQSAAGAKYEVPDQRVQSLSPNVAACATHMRSFKNVWRLSSHLAVFVCVYLLNSPGASDAQPESDQGRPLSQIRKPRLREGPAHPQLLRKLIARIQVAGLSRPWRTDCDVL